MWQINRTLYRKEADIDKNQNEEKGNQLVIYKNEGK